ncbi:hypothetical protein ACGFT2_31955 [Streptomyces sp. NPDC048514]|uniref:hypothetical protein n=1 Tax=Streptomyces sp. NPDC048514 TaxID=3365564 RepID=UPI003712F3B9
MIRAHRAHRTWPDAETADVKTVDVDTAEAVAERSRPTDGIDPVVASDDVGVGVGVGVGVEEPAGAVVLDMEVSR